MSWNYRVICHQSPAEEMLSSWYIIKEVYYDDLGKPDGMTERPAFPFGETLEELKQDLLYMLEALDKPILEDM